MSEKIKDDWMNPVRGGAVAYTRTPPKEFIIQRMKAAPVYSWLGSPPGPTWVLWAEFDGTSERDEELARLRKTTTWALRPARQKIVGGEVWDFAVEDEESDLMFRLAILRARKKSKAYASTVPKAAT